VVAGVQGPAVSGWLPWQQTCVPGCQRPAAAPRWSLAAGGPGGQQEESDLQVDKHNIRVNETKVIYKHHEAKKGM